MFLIERKEQFLKKTWILQCLLYKYKKIIIIIFFICHVQSRSSIRFLKFFIWGLREIWPLTPVHHPITPPDAKNKFIFRFPSFCWLLWIYEAIHFQKKYLHTGGLFEPWCNTNWLISTPRTKLAARMYVFVCVPRHRATPHTVFCVIRLVIFLFLLKFV